MRTTPLPLDHWPAPQFDDETVDSIIRTMDVQQAAGFNMFDVWGLFATYGWPLDIVSAIDDDRRRRVNTIINAAKARGIKPVLGLGTYSWGYDKIIEANPELRGKDQTGAPHPHAMCDANPAAFEYVKRIIDVVLGEFDFEGVHLESCDLGCCHCPECAGKDGMVGYNARINQKTADYIKSQWPEKIVYVITISWIPPMKHFSPEELDQVVELSRHVDCIFDQGHRGFHVAPDQRREFIPRLHSAYGTSGELWLYPDAHWDRGSYFLPYISRAGEGLKRQHEDGVRGCMFYQGPVANPGAEAMIAVGGRILADTSRSVEDVLSEVLELYYKPKTTEAHKLLLSIFQRAEETYFSHWSAERFAQMWGAPVPGEFMLDQHLFTTFPGPATYLKEPSLDAEGRKAYKAGLISILGDLPKLAGQCDDGGRVERIQRGVIVTSNLVSTVQFCMGEPL
jgi:hypothetical protein